MESNIFDEATTWAWVTLLVSQCEKLRQMKIQKESICGHFQKKRTRFDWKSVEECEGKGRLLQAGDEGDGLNALKRREDVA